MTRFTFSQKTNQSASSKDPITFHFQPKTPDQITAVKKFDENEIVFFVGPPKCGKTIVALALGIREVLAGRKEKIVFTRPLVEAGEELGFLPGDTSEKTWPYRGAIRHSLKKLTFKEDLPFLQFETLAYMRGMTFEKSIMILDEAQNCTEKQLRLFLTRMGIGSKAIILGDPEQSDISTNGEEFLNVVEALESTVGISIVDFDEEITCGHPLVTVVDRILLNNERRSGQERPPRGPYNLRRKA